MKRKTRKDSLPRPTPCSECLRMALGTCPKMFFTSVRMPCGSFTNRRDKQGYPKRERERILTRHHQEALIRKKMERSLLKDPTIISKEPL